MFKKICSFLSALILIALAVLAGMLLIPRVMGYQTMAVLTGSMEPNYHVGSLIYVKEVDPSSLKKGDVITYRISDETVVTHRIVEVHSDSQEVVTKGDANNANDGNPVAYANIVGKAEFNIPYLGFIAINAKTPKGIIAICAVLVLIILLTFLPEIFSKDDEDGKDESKKKKKRKNQKSSNM